MGITAGPTAGVGERRSGVVAVACSPVFGRLQDRASRISGRSTPPRGPDGPGPAPRRRSLGSGDQPVSRARTASARTRTGLLGCRHTPTRNGGRTLSSPAPVSRTAVEQQRHTPVSVSKNVGWRISRALWPCRGRADAKSASHESRSRRGAPMRHHERVGRRDPPGPSSGSYFGYCTRTVCVPASWSRHSSAAGSSTPPRSPGRTPR